MEESNPITSKPLEGALPALTLRLYVAGSSENSLRAIVNLRAICQNYLGSHSIVETIDILQDPKFSFTDGVFATPSLVKLSPLPVCKIIGDLSETDKVLLALGVQHSRK